ncbi:MAG: hypothetical protein QOE73_2654 [Verrucomicrobiota bacterium]
MDAACAGWRLSGWAHGTVGQVTSEFPRTQVGCSAHPDKNSYTAACAVFFVRLARTAPT